MEQVFPSYDVFINHRGPDVKRTLASLIHRDLKRFGLSVFLDEKELQTGDSLSPAIMAAISSSSVHIAIFSPRYAESAWCLNELLWMLGCDGSKIIAIFYDIQPSDLRYIDKGAYADAFRNHRNLGRVDNAVVERWINALNKVSHNCGLVFNKDKDDLGAFLDRIVEDVLKYVPTEPLDVAKHPVGLDQAAEHFQIEILNQTELSESSSAMVVGIVGLGGSGKSTLVKYLYNLKRSEFRRCCFLADVSKTPLPFLHQKLLIDLLGYRPHFRIENTGKLLRDQLRGLPRALIVFDDINDAEQIENLLFVKDVLGNGSLILVTSRDRALLSRSQIHILYDVKLLDVKAGRQLFCWHAFHQPIPLQNFRDLVEEMVEMCGGFPLALKVLGGHLSGNHDRSSWKRQLKNFRMQLPNDILQKVLKISYDSLTDDEKEAFLDIAHFLIEEDRDLAVSVLEGLVDCSGLECLATLHQKCLVEFENADVDFNIEIEHEDNIPEPFYIELWRRPKGSFKIRMHDLVRDLARQIGREQYAFRLCCSSYGNTCTQPICNSKLSSGVQGICIRGIRMEKIGDEVTTPGHAFLQDEQVHGLKLLALENTFLRFNVLSGDLKWLRFLKSKSNNIPSALSLRNLRALELSDANFEDLSRVFDQPPSHQLRDLTINFDIPFFNSDTWFHRSFLPWLGKLNFKSLVKVALKNIKGTFQSLPIPFEELRNLRHLDLSGCNALKVLPDSFIQLSQLQYLALRDCSKLVLPDLGEISTLEYIDFGGCCSLTQLPRGTTAQRSLRYLNLLNTTVEELPEHLEQLKNLEQLYIGSLRLKSLPCSLNNLGQLTDLILYDCGYLYDISKSIEGLSSLERLRIYELGANYSWERISWMNILPEGSGLMNIKVMDLQRCPIKGELKIGENLGMIGSDSVQIQGSVDHGADCLGEVAIKAAHDNRESKLTNLIIRKSYIDKVYIHPGKSLFPNLEIVDLSNNSNLKEIAGLPDNLIRLNLMCCRILETLTCVSNLSRLKSLNISGCERLKTLNVEGLSSIEVIQAERCWNLQSIEGLRQLQTLSVSRSQHGIASLVLLGETYCVKFVQAFPPNISTAVVCGATVNEEDVDEMDIFAHRFQHGTVMDIHSLPVERGNIFSVKLEKVSLGGENAILVCLVADMYCDFTVTLCGHEYNTICIEVDGDAYRAYAFLWTQESGVFKDLKCEAGALYCNIRALNPEKARPSNETKAGLKRGWIVRTKDLECCKQFLHAVLVTPPRF